MTSEQILHAVDKYELTLSSQDVIPEKADLSVRLVDQKAMLAHCMWMCGGIRDILRTPGKEGKAARWLCFIQGVLWSTGLGTVDEFRGDNTWLPPV
jgi:hypothetical protein